MLFINYLRNLYQHKQLRKREKTLNRVAVIGEKFSTQLDANIFNESGERNRIEIGNECRLLGYIFCCGKGTVKIGDYSTIQSKASIRCVNSIQIGCFSGIAENTLITDNNTHPTDIHGWIEHRIRVSPSGPGYPGLGFGWELSQSAPVVIGDGVWVGGECTILKGVIIGDGAIVARGSVVTKDVEPFTIVAGNPAKNVKQLEVPDVSVMELARSILEKHDE